jgi:hypothetical protein
MVSGLCCGVKSTLAVLGICLIPLVVSASPFHVFSDIPEAITIGETGWTALLFQIADDGPAIHLGRALGRRIDVFTTVTTGDLFRPGLRALLVKDLGPLNAVLTVTEEKIGLTSGLRLGPVHLDWGRDFGVRDHRWGTLVAFPDQRFGMVLGLEIIKGKMYPLFGIRLFPTSGLRGVSFLIRPVGFSMTFGGTF